MVLRSCITPPVGLFPSANTAKSYISTSYVRKVLVLYERVLLTRHGGCAGVAAPNPSAPAQAFASTKPRAHVSHSRVIKGVREVLFHSVG